jgi:hypothetical protein
MHWDEGPLFQSQDLSSVLAFEEQQMLREIESASEERALNADESEWVAYVVSHAKVEPIKLHGDRWELEDLGDQRVDVRGDPNRLIRDPARPSLIAGHAAKLRIPFDGNVRLLRLRSNTFVDPPIAGVEDNEIVKRYEWPTDVDPPDLKGMAEQLIERLERSIRWSTEQVENHNRELERLACDAVRTRRERLRATHSHLQSFGIPVRRRGDAPKTYAAPGVHRRSPPIPPSGAAAAGIPEPVLIDEFYDHIITVIRAWGKAVERTPGPYKDFDEETLRAALLPMLNSHYEGAATGETFNAGGKTDVLIRVEDRTVFIGECKWWKGPKGVGEALDQLFSYTTWRDTKLALLFLVGGKDPTKAYETTQGLLENNDLFVSWKDSGNERELRCLMRWPRDEDVAAELHVSFVHVPKDS